MKPNILRLKEELGNKAKPLIAYYMEINEMKDPELIKFFNGWFYYLKGNYAKTIEVFSSGFDTLAMDMRASIVLMVIYYNMNDTENITYYYNHMKDSIENLSGLLEYDVKLQLGWYEAVFLNDYKRITKLKPSSNKYYAFHCYYAKARLEFIFKKDYEAGIEFSKIALNLANECKKPALKFMILNTYAYNSFMYGKNILADELARELSYIIGYMLDEEQFSQYIPVMSSVITITKNKRTEILFKNLIMNSLNKRHVFQQKAIEIDNQMKSHMNNDFTNFIKELKAKYKDEIEIPVEIEISHIKRYSEKNLEVFEKRARIYNPDISLPLENARIELFNIFIECLGSDKKEKFSNFYFSCNKEEKKEVEKFVLNYSRYLNFLDYIDIVTNKKSFYYTFFEKSNLDPVIATIVIFIWDKEERVNIENLVEKMINHCYN